MSEAERLRLEFAARGKVIAGVFLLDAKASIEFVRACRSKGLDIAGVEGFRLSGNAIQPRQEDSNDYEGAPPNRHADCIAFLTKRLTSGLWFEVVLEAPNDSMSAGSLIPRLARYIEGCGEAGFGAKIRGADPALLAEFERLYRGPIPADYLEFVRAMGGESAGFYFYSKHDGGFADVVGFYRDHDEPDILPRGGSILIAIGDNEEYGIDGSLPDRRPVGIWNGSRFDPRFADSFEAYCFRRAWWLFRYPRFPHWDRVILRTASAGMFEDACSAALRAGLDRVGFSDSRNRIYEGEDAVCLQWLANGQLHIYAASNDEARAKALAKSISFAAR